MAYSELIKNFERIRDYMRQFYVYGFKIRSEYDAKSSRSYDNERRRIESWLGDYMSFRLDTEGKRVFLSVDSRQVLSNPLYSALKAKSFTPGDILFHFCILDLLADGEEYSVTGIMDQLYFRYFSEFDDGGALDESTVRKKLREYVRLGVLESDKRGRELIYRRSQCAVDLEGWKDAAAFFSEADPLGAVGSFILDKYSDAPDYFRFKHHYILHSLDSQILCRILEAMRSQLRVTVNVKSNGGKSEREHTVFPMKIFVSTQTGRQYLLAYHIRFRKTMFFRLDTISSVIAVDPEPDAGQYLGYADKLRENLWGVSLGSGGNMDHIEMTVRVEDGEEYIVHRLRRECRCGMVEMIDSNTYRFSADVYDAAEMKPWIRTFIGRIVSLECSDPDVTETICGDLELMQEMYGGESDAVQRDIQ